MEEDWKERGRVSNLELHVGLGLESNDYQVFFQFFALPFEQYFIGHARSELSACKDILCECKALPPRVGGITAV
jgi:hypothetical protein